MREREREQEKSAGLVSTVFQVRVNTAWSETIGPWTLSFTSITLSVLLSVHLKIIVPVPSAPLKLTFQTPSSQIRAGYCRCMIGEKVTSVRGGNRYRIAWLCLITHQHTQTHELCFVHSVHYNSIFTTWTNKAHSCHLIHDLIFKTLNSYMIRE
jgi:hypothetical protein